MSRLGYTKGDNIKQNVEFLSSAYKRIRIRKRKCKRKRNPGRWGAQSLTQVELFRIPSAIIKLIIRRNRSVIALTLILTLSLS